MSRQVYICWGKGAKKPIDRIVLDPTVSAAPAVREQARRLRLPIIEAGPATLQAHDLWINSQPIDGWGDLSMADVVMWADAIKNVAIVDVLKTAVVVETCWVIENTNGTFIRGPTNPSQTTSVNEATKFDDKDEASRFLSRNKWLAHNGSKPKRIEVTLQAA